MQNTGVHIAIGAKYRGKINENTGANRPLKYDNQRRISVCLPVYHHIQAAQERNSHDDV